jgi:tetratricopeptide (TPR) repeat protein
MFQKILELDPENAHTQAKLADLYTKLGKKDEARNIYFSAAESLYARGSYTAAEEALGKVLAIDPTNASALMLRGLISVEAGDSQAAVIYLEQVTDIDSRPDGLRALLRAKLHTGNPDGVEEVAEKLLAKHNDITGVTTTAQWYVTNNREESALRLYEKHSERLFGGNPAALQETLGPLASRVQNNPAALAILNRLTNKAGGHAQTAEVIEVQAHAAAQKGNFAEARDLYQKLTEMEPENAIHAQNHKQMLVKLGEDSATRILTPEEAAQAFMVEELDETATQVQQNYDPPTEKAIESALTDAELYVSYNVPAKAIPPLEAALPLAPHDVNLNQRLASLYARAERYGDAARMYQNLSKIYDELGHPTEAAKYLEAAKKFALRVPATAAPVTPPTPAPAPAKATWPPPPAETKPAAPPEPVAEAPVEIEAEPSVQEFSFDTTDIVGEHEPAASAPIDVTPAAAAAAVIPSAPPPVGINFEPVAMDAPAREAAPEAAEIDISNEWEEMIEVEPEEAPALALEVQSDQEIMAEPAMAAEVPLEPVMPIEPEQPDVATQVADKIQEIRFYITQQMWEQAKTAILDLTELSPDAPEVTELIAQVSKGQAGGQAGVAPAAVEVAPVEIEEAPEPVAPIEIVEPPAPEPLHAAPVIEDRPAAAQPAAAFDLENVLDIAEPPPKAKPTAKKVPPPQPAAQAAQSTEDILGDFLQDLEQSDLADFAPQPTASAPAPTLEPVMAAVPAPVPAPAPIFDKRSNGDMKDTESANVLSDILSELQEETAEAAEPEEDPETHYNLGIAFKEMGLLDEAIGELQKVCHAVDRGAPFSQPIQALTWLAQCLVDKGAPEAAVRWYQKALQLPGLDSGSRCSIYYDLGAAYQAAGDNKAALTNFMEVYGSNIDFRDVASRIKALKA